MVPGVAGAEVAVLAVPVEDREEGDVLELPQLRNGKTAVLVLLVRLVRVVAPLSGPGEAVRCERRPLVGQNLTRRIAAPPHSSSPPR